MFPAWRSVAQAILRPQPEIAQVVARQIRPIFSSWEDAWQSRQFAAMHVRRTDKVQANNYTRFLRSNHLHSEATAFNACLYVAAVARVSHNATNIAVFVASDVPHIVMHELQSCRMVNELGWSMLTSHSLPKRSFHNDSHYTLWADITVLSRARWVALTLSSNVGQLVQLMRTQPPESAASLDIK